MFQEIGMSNDLSQSSNAKLVRYCCGSAAKEYTAYTIDNYGRRFYTCCRNGSPAKCEFFLWIDEPFTGRANEVIKSLIVKKNSMFEDGCKMALRITELDQFDRDKSACMRSMSADLTTIVMDQRDEMRDRLEQIEPLKTEKMEAIEAARKEKIEWVEATKKTKKEWIQAARKEKEEEIEAARKTMTTHMFIVCSLLTLIFSTIVMGVGK